MNRSALKKYAPQARLDFIEAVTQRARRLGLDPTQPVNIEQNGDVLMIRGQPFPATIAKQRATLDLRIQQQGFSAVVEALAYTWFNRLVAIRFMELKGYLSHGYRVLSHPQGQQPEILDHVQHLELTGLDKAEVIRLKTAGNQDEALYREILLGQCHELHRNMPFLFEALDDSTELLLPDNLLRTDSPIARLVNDIEEDDWQEVEVIGWLYQFYISEKKDEVIGKVVKSEDIPAATQLFTPNWIVQYLVQNSLGRLWLMANPGSSLKEKMPYYIDPADQTPEVRAQLDMLIKVRMDEDGGSLNPESLTVLDPACGSGHILVVAYDLLRTIYEERGYRSRDIPRLILQKNLHGLDIDDRAAQLAGFALMMKAREEDRRLFDDETNPPRLNVMAIHQSADLPDEEMARAILNAAIQIEGGDAFHSGQLFGGGQLETQHSSGLTVLHVRQLIQVFTHGKTIGSLIRVPDAIQAKLGSIVDLLAVVGRHGDDLSRSYASQVLEKFAWPASLLSLRYDAVVANPPYMGSKGMSPALKEFAKKYYPDSKTDLFAMFLERGFAWCSTTGFNSMVTMQSWMFLSSFERLRLNVLKDRAVSSFVHIGYNSFPELNSKIALACAFVIGAKHFSGWKVAFRGLNNCEQSTDKGGRFLAAHPEDNYVKSQDSFAGISGSPISYWLPDSVLESFRKNKLISDVSFARIGMATGNNAEYVRLWHEINISCIGFGFSRAEAARSGIKWFPYAKGGGLRRWYGNCDSVVNWQNDGHLLQTTRHPSGDRVWGHNFNLNEIYKPALCWTVVTSSVPSFRYHGAGYIFDAAAGLLQEKTGEDIYSIAALLNSASAAKIVDAINPTLNLHPGYIGALPYSNIPDSSYVGELISIHKVDWDSSETSWDFSINSLIFSSRGESLTLAGAWRKEEERSRFRYDRVMYLEGENNKFFNRALGFEECDLSVSVKPTVFLKEKSVAACELLSYSIGCMMGRYSLDEPGLIYAHSGGVGFDSSLYNMFQADIDGIIPIIDEPWFQDDAAERIREFIKVVWGADSLVENMEWLADSLSRKSDETADETIRRYLTTSFYKDHLQTYKKRPIYWLFSSGKHKAFECLVYLHRYNEGTLSRMRMEYVVPLQSRMQARIDKLADDISSATGSAQQKALQKRKDKFTKQLEELRRFDETLRPYADQRIALNLDDGVKVNYGKFGDLLAEVKAITGSKED